MTAFRVCDPGYLGGSVKSKSFVDALAGSSAHGGFAELKPSTFCGIPSLWISEDEILALVAPFQFALVGFFPSLRLSLDFIRKFFFNLKLIAEFSVTLLDSSHVLIKLSNDLDYSRVFCHRSYLVYNCFMKVTKWSPSLYIGVESHVIPIWVSFPKLRPHIFSPWILHALGSMFGQPLKVDNATSMDFGASVAWVLVELDITKKNSDKIWLGPKKFGYIQLVEMEDFSSFCYSCKCIRHIKGECSSHSSVPNTGHPIMSNLTPSDGNVIVNASAALNTVDLDGISPLKVMVVLEWRSAGDLPLVTCGTELLSGLVRSTPLISSAIASDNLVADDISTKPIENLDPQSVGLDHPLDDMVEDATARVSSPNDNVISDANQNVDGGNIDLCDANKAVLVESSNDLNAIIGVSPVASLGVQITPHVEVVKGNEPVFDVPFQLCLMQN
ncbi:hypothetical protein M5K25_002357 [Dendrobium thyrsiflorum]|uniref:DUF4283 domain-containing protein n=1 Tax=Dendrobium thyrsiflorum TaxID=117978 RepID=A0ABD0W470_DENTH